MKCPLHPTPFHPTLRGLALAASLALAAPSFGGDRVDLITRTGVFTSNTVIRTIDLDAGGVLLDEALLLQTVTPFGLPVAFDVARIGGELWVATADGLLRYSTAPLAFLGQSLAGERMAAMTPTSFGAVVTSAIGQAIEVDLAGMEIRRFTQLGVNMVDIDAFQSGYLVTVDNRVLQYDANFVLQGEFAAAAFALAQQGGFNYDPEELNVLSDGRVTIGGVTSIAVAAPDGSVLAMLNPLIFESAAFLTGGGSLLIPHALGLALFDEASGTTVLTQDPFDLPGTPRYGSVYSVASSQSSGRTCSATLNSTGREARIQTLASTQAAFREMATVGTGMPAGSFGLPIYGMIPTSLPFGDGLLCISPLSPSFTRGPVGRVSAAGSLATELDFVTPGLGAGFVAGSTWYHQILFRDTGPSGLDTTDAIFVTFEP